VAQDRMVGLYVQEKWGRKSEGAGQTQPKKVLLIGKGWGEGNDTQRNEVKQIVLSQSEKKNRKKKKRVRGRAGSVKSRKRKHG